MYGLLGMLGMTRTVIIMCHLVKSDVINGAMLFSRNMALL